MGLKAVKLVVLNADDEIDIKALSNAGKYKEFAARLASQGGFGSYREKASEV